MTFIRISTEELKEQKLQLQMFLDNKFVWYSSSKNGATVFFIMKKDGDLRLVCDYRALNKIAVNDTNPLPLVEEVLGQVSGAIFFSQIDLVGVYHQLIKKEDDDQKKAIRNSFGSFDWLV